MHWPSLCRHLITFMKENSGPKYDGDFSGQHLQYLQWQLRMSIICVTLYFMGMDAGCSKRKVVECWKWLSHTTKLFFRGRYVSGFNNLSATDSSFNFLGLKDNGNIWNFLTAFISCTFGHKVRANKALCWDWFPQQCWTRVWSCAALHLW